MNLSKVTTEFFVAPQLDKSGIDLAIEHGIRSFICNRPDNEDAQQPKSDDLKAYAESKGAKFISIPVSGGNFTDQAISDFKQNIESLEKPCLAFCRSGTRSITLWVYSQLGEKPVDELLGLTETAGYDLTHHVSNFRDAEKYYQNVHPDSLNKPSIHKTYEIVIVGGGAAGISTAASILKRKPSANILIIEPNDKHYYQPGWTMVGGGIFTAEQTVRNTKDLIPKNVTWLQAAVTEFHPDLNYVEVNDGNKYGYEVLVAAPGIKLDWDAIEGLSETLGKNNVTTNYEFQHAPYTWELVQKLKRGRAIFTQPPMPIKCAGAPQKVMYLSSDHWLKQGVLKDIEVNFNNAGAVIFGVDAYVPALTEYLDKYNVKRNWKHNLKAVNGSQKKAWFDKTNDDGSVESVEMEFDMLHVCPPQTAPDFVRSSPLANEAGWIAVSDETLQHPTYPNVFSLGDACSSANAKTAAAVRKQVPVVADNVVAFLEHEQLPTHYYGYGSCPLTVERGKIVLAEFGRGKLRPTLPLWMLNGTKPTRAAWLLKEQILPPLYWHAMLKGREWLTKSLP